MLAFKVKHGFINLYTLQSLNDLLKYKFLVVELNSNLLFNFANKTYLKVRKNLWKFKESLILAQDERWRDALYMQVVRD